MKSTCGQPHELVEVCRQACNRVKAVGEIRSEEGRFLFRKGKMPIDDERRRLSRTKAMPGTAPQIRTSAIGEPEPKERVEESLQRLYEMVLLERAKQVEFCEREEERVQTQRQAVQRARNDRNERHDRLQQAFERLDRWRGEEGAEAAREESRRSQDGDGFRLVEEVLERYRQQHIDARAFLENLFRERREENRGIIEIIRRNPNPPEPQSKTSVRRPEV